MHGSINKKGQCERFMNLSVTLHIYFFFVQGKNIFTHIFLNEEHLM